MVVEGVEGDGGGGGGWWWRGWRVMVEGVEGGGGWAVRFVDRCCHYSSHPFNNYSQFITLTMQRQRFEINVYNSF